VFPLFVESLREGFFFNPPSSEKISGISRASDPPRLPRLLGKAFPPLLSFLNEIEGLASSPSPPFSKGGEIEDPPSFSPGTLRKGSTPPFYQFESPPGLAIEVNLDPSFPPLLKARRILFFSLFIHMENALLFPLSSTCSAPEDG